MVYPPRLAAQDRRQSDIQVKRVPRCAPKVSIPPNGKVPLGDTRNDNDGVVGSEWRFGRVHSLECKHYIHMAAPVAALFGASRAAIDHLRQVEAQAEVLPERIAQAGADAGDAHVCRGERARWNVLIVAAAKVVEPKRPQTAAQAAPLLDQFG